MTSLLTAGVKVANQRRVNYDYKTGQIVYVKVIDPAKLDKRSEGP